MWNVIRSAVSPSTNHSSASPQSLKICGITFGDSRLVATHFNNFFCTIGANLAKNFEDAQPNSYAKYLHQRISSSIYLDIPKPTEMENVVHSLNLNKAVGYDNMPSFFLRTAYTVITPYLHIFIEFCFCNGTFFEDCATAKIVPIIKKGKKDDPSNYRPISILTCFSKIMEKIIHKRLMSFLNKQKVIQKINSAFEAMCPLITLF